MNKIERLRAAIANQDWLAIVAALDGDLSPEIADYCAGHSSIEPGTRMNLETHSKYWEGAVRFACPGGVVLESVVSVFTQGESSQYYGSGPREAESLGDQIVGVSAHNVCIATVLHR